MFTRIQTLAKGLPWRWIAYAIAVAIWSVGWGVGAAVVYCHRELGGHVEAYVKAGRILSETEALSATRIHLSNKRGELIGWLDASGFRWMGGDADASLDASGFRWEKGNTYARFSADGFLFTKGKSGLAVSFDEDGNPSVTLADPAGKDRLVLGSAQTLDRKSGAKRTAPVSSITLFGKDGMVTKQIE